MLSIFLLVIFFIIISVIVILVKILKVIFGKSILSLGICGIIGNFVTLMNILYLNIVQGIVHPIRSI
jgi:hypothetical protein